MTGSRKTAFSRIFFCLSALVCLWGILPALACGAPPTRSATEGGTGTLPHDLGEVVYRTNRQSPRQVFIVVDSHRSNATGANGPTTVKAQIDTFRIGEWLIRNKQVALLLPEGFFGPQAGIGPRRTPSRRISSESLQEKLTDTGTFVNAELLLYRRYGIRMHQVEDRNLYCRARKILDAALRQRAPLSPCADCDLAYLQKRRLAAMLQRAPAAIASEYRRGTISMPKAMLTIGMAHLKDIVRFLEKGQIHIPAAPGDFEAYNAPLELKKDKVEVTVIVPRALLKKRQPFPRMAELEPSLESRP